MSSVRACESTAEWPKITQIAPIYCPQTGLAMLYAFEILAAIVSHALNIKRERRKSRRPFKKSKPAPLTGRRPSILPFMKTIGAIGV